MRVLRRVRRARGRERRTRSVGGFALSEAGTGQGRPGRASPSAVRTHTATALRCWLREDAPVRPASPDSSRRPPSCPSCAPLSFLTARGTIQILTLSLSRFALVLFFRSQSTTAAATSAAPPRPHVGPSTLLFSPAPRPLIPLTTSPMNHKLWNPPAEGSGGAGGAGVAERDESGRLAKFEKRFGDAFGGFGGPEASDAAGAAGAGAGAAGAAGAAARAAKAQEEMYRGLMEGDGTGRALGQVVGKEHLQKAKRVKPQKGRR